VTERRLVEIWRPFQGFASLAPLFIALAAGCATSLPAQKPSDTYLTADGPAVGATKDEEDFIDDLNEELMKEGWPLASPGANEMKAKEAAQQFAQALEEWRAKHGLPVLPINEQLSGWARTEAIFQAAEESKAHGSPVNHRELGSQADRLRADGIEPKKASVTTYTWRAETFRDQLSELLENPKAVARLAAPEATALGIGATYLPKESQDDPTDYHLVWLVASREALRGPAKQRNAEAARGAEPPKAIEGPSAAPPSEQSPSSTAPSGEGQPPVGRGPGK
jgi:hypothetical protein